MTGLVLLIARMVLAYRYFRNNGLRPAYWVDTRRFLSKTKHKLADGMFEIFSDFTNESVGTVQDNLMGWIYDNYCDVEKWTHLLLHQKGITLS